MKKSRYSESQIVKILKEVEDGRLVKEVCRECGRSARLKIAFSCPSSSAVMNTTKLQTVKLEGGQVSATEMVSSKLCKGHVNLW